MRESRANAYSMNRNIAVEKRVSCVLFITMLCVNSYFPTKNFQQLINTIIQEELSKEVENNIELHDNILKEIFNSWEEWQKEEYEKEMMSLDLDNDEDRVFCPVCQLYLLDLEENIISCKCGLRLKF
jgi:hypothetical protein